MESSPSDAHPPQNTPDPRLVGADRVLAVLTELARHPQGTTLDELGRALRTPKTNVHRALAALRRAGLAEQDGRGHYVLGEEFLRLAFSHHEARPDHVRVLPVLTALTERYRETTHYAVLDGDAVVYRSKVDPPTGSIRLTSTVGGRNPAHSTAVGKLLLALTLPDDAAAHAWARARTLEPRTPRTLTQVEDLTRELAAIRRQGYALDDQENEPGVVCLALPAYLTSPTVPSGAVSISALAFRTPVHVLLDDLPVIRDLCRPIQAGLRA